MRILLTNNSLDHTCQDAVFTGECASQLSGRDHDVICYSRQHGEVADFLTNLGISVVTELSEIPIGWEPEIIHGQHEWETSIAALRYPTTPILSFCNDAETWQEAPCTAPNVVKYVASDYLSQDRLVKDELIPESEIEIIFHGIDLYRFPERKKFPKKPESVLVFPGSEIEEDFPKIIQQACEAEGVGCNVIENHKIDPAPFLKDADLVFASGKTALKACASGAMVVICDKTGISTEPVTPENFEQLRKVNFSTPPHPNSHEFENYREAIKSYSAKVAKKTCQLARETADLEKTVDQLEGLYEHTIEIWENGHGEELADFDTFSQWAAAFFEKKTWAYKTGRESQEIWQKTAGIDTEHASRYAKPFTPDGEEIEAHRIIETVKNAFPLSQKLDAAERELNRIGKKIPEKISANQ